MAASRYLDATAFELPMGLGSRHLAAASISKVTQASSIVVSESAIVRIFEDGSLVGDIIPELWLMNRERVVSKGRRSQRVRRMTYTTEQKSFST